MTARNVFPSCRRGFTLIELLVVISIIALLIGILLPALSAARKVANENVCATRIRGYQQGMVAFAQDNGGWYPGLNSNGEIIPDTEINATGTYSEPNSHGASNGARQAIMLSRRFITPEYAISPSDRDKQPWDPNSGNGIQVQNISYSMLKITATNAPGRKVGDATANPTNVGQAREWRDTFNSRSIVMSDRPISYDIGAGGLDPNSGMTFSVHSEHTGAPNWRGHVVYNDNHVEFLTNHVASTQYADGPTINKDNIFLHPTEGAQDHEIGGGQTPTQAVGHTAVMVFRGHNQRFDAIGK